LEVLAATKQGEPVAVMVKIEFDLKILK